MGTPSHVWGSDVGLLGCRRWQRYISHPGSSGLQGPGLPNPAASAYLSIPTLLPPGAARLSPSLDSAELQ